jgi:O-antigen ligase
MSERTKRGVGTVACVAAIAGLVLLVSPLHLAGAILLVLGVAVICLAMPDVGLWLVLLLFAVHPLVSKVVQVNFGVTETPLLLFSAWKEVALASVLIARLGALAISYRRERRWRFRPALMDVVAFALVLLVVFGLAMRHDSAAFNASRLLLFPVGVYFALRLSPVEAGTYLRLAVIIAIGISAFAVVQSSFLGFPFVTSYWGRPDLQIPGTFTAQYLQGPRASGTFASPNELGLALTAWLLMAASLIVLKPTKSRWAMAALFAMTVAIALTFSRGALLACAVGMVIIFVAGRRISPNPRRTFACLSLAIVPALLLGGVMYSTRGGTTLLANTFVFLSAVPTATPVATPTATPTTTPVATPTASAGTPLLATALSVYVSTNPWPAGSAHSVKVTALDADGIVAVGYTGTIHFTTSDPSGDVPADYKFTAADKGAHSFTYSVKPVLTLRTVGTQWVRATDTTHSTITGTTEDIAVLDATPVERSAEGHFKSLSNGWSIVQSHPLGVGLGTVGSRSDPQTSERPQYIFESWYITMGASLGWLGLAWAVFLPLAMFLSAFVALRRRRSLAGLALMGLSIAIAIEGYALPTMMQPQIAMLPWSLAALVLCPVSGQATKPEEVTT